MIPTHLRAFHLVANAGSFTLAARTAGVSQPTLSAQVRALESTYGVSLFDRRGRGVQLTPLGQSLQQITSRMFAAEDEARALLAGNRWVLRGHLRVAADSAHHAIPVLAAMRRRHSGLTFELQIGNSAQVLGHVQSFAADVAVMALPVSDPRLTSEPIRRDKLTLFVPVNHPWAERGHVALADLAGQALVLRERGSITREVFETALASAGVKPGRLFEVQSREAVAEAVAGGFGVGIIFASELGEDRRFRAVAIAGADLVVGEYAVALAERRKLALVAAFFAAAADCAHEQGWLA
ncbi:MAG: LysR substrate-binding domain-containing protein [Beijerinckiaceae bacterium]